MMSPSRETSDGRIQHLDSVTSILIWTLPFVHIEEITEENLDEAFLRIRTLELAQGPILGSSGKERFLSLDDLRRRIGLCVWPGIAFMPFEEIVLAKLRGRAQEALTVAKAAPHTPPQPPDSPL